MKVGDKIRVTPIKSIAELPRGEYTVTSIDHDSFDVGIKGKPYYTLDSDYYEIKILTNNMSNIPEAFSLAFKSEPEKSFRKAGITNGDDLLTEDGKTVFLGWLLNTHKNAFKTEVVDAILKEQEEKK